MGQTEISEETMCVIHIHYIYDLLENHNLEIINHNLPCENQKAFSILLALWSGAVVEVP